MSKKNKISRVHHYVPQFHLKGFLNDKGSFFVFDKITGKLRETNTRDVLFEKDRNTAIFPNGEKTDCLEEIYADIEKVFLSVFEKIQKQKWSAKFSHKDKLSISLYIATLYWRLPTSDVISDKIRETEGFKAIPFKLFRKDGSRANDKEARKALSVDGLMKSYRLLLPFATFYKQDYPTRVFNWRFLFNNPGYFMIGDNPVIKRGEGVDTDILDEFVIPLSKECLLINNAIVLSGKLPEEFFVQMGLTIFHQSERFVCCHDKLFLEKIINLYYSVCKKFGKTGIIKSDLFDMIDKNND
jgi:hypothetical protein